MVQPGSEPDTGSRLDDAATAQWSALSRNAPPEIDRLALAMPVCTSKLSPSKTQAKRTGGDSTMVTGLGATAKTVTPPAAIRPEDNHKYNPVSSKDTQAERQDQMDEFTRFLRTIANGQLLTDMLLIYINIKPVYKMSQEQRQGAMTWLVTITVDKRHNQGYNTRTQLFQDIRTAARILAKVAFGTPWGKNPVPSLIHVKNAQSKVLDGRIRYMAAMAEEIKAELDDLKIGAEMTSQSLVRPLILETIRAINNWSQYNPEANPQRTGDGDLHIELAAELIKQTFMRNLQDDNDFVNYIENSLLNNVSIMVIPWLRQPEVIQRSIIWRLGTIKKNGKQRRDVSIYVRIAEILDDIKAVTIGQMHEAAKEAQTDD